MANFMRPGGKLAQKRKTPSGLGCILVVEDDGLLAIAIEQALLDAGAREVILCSSTDTALAALRKKRPDALVLDVHLADRDDGWAIAELVRDVGPNPPRVVFSTGSPQDIPAEIAELGPILEKPYDPGDLIEAIRGPNRRGLFSRLRRPA